MTVVLSIGQGRALAELLPKIDDREITMHETEGVLCVDPKVMRVGMDTDPRVFYITKLGKVSEKMPETRKEVVGTESIHTRKVEPKKEKKKKKDKKKKEDKPPEPPAE